MLVNLKTIGLLLLFLTLVSGMRAFNAFAQSSGARMIEADTIEVDTTYWAHSPRKAAMFSAVFPGMGQLYNKKYWKVPLVYAGMGALVYSSILNSQEYRMYFDKYKYMMGTGLDEYEGQTLKLVELYKNYHLRNKNLFIIFTVGFYVLQIIDANVDAHLMDYDISDDLSLNIDPVISHPAGLETGVCNSPLLGLRCCLSF